MAKKKEKNKVFDGKEKMIDHVVDLFTKGELTTATEISDYIKDLMSPVMQKVLDAELTNHLGNTKYSRTNKNTNSRNGYCKPKTVKTENGEMILKTPRDRQGTFEPIIIQKGQTKLEGFEEKCISLYAKGVSLRDIEALLKSMYKVEISKDQISTLIASVSEEVESWRNRRLKPLYTFVYADCLYVPIKDDIASQKNAIYVLIGIDANGFKDVLGIWRDLTESGSFWSLVFEDIKKRGVEDIIYVTSDGIAGFKSSIELTFPKAIVQRCIVHLVRNVYGLCAKKHAKEVIADLKKIYTSTNFEQAQDELYAFEIKHKDKKVIVKKVQEFMVHFKTLFELPNEIRYYMYTTNAIESVNSALRKVTRGKGSFPSEASLFKILFLRIKDLKSKWSKPVPKWNIVSSQLASLYGERYTKHIEI